TDKSVIWKSSDESIAIVDENGKVTAIAVGIATITATSASGVSATCEINVIETPVENVVVDFFGMGIDGDNLEMHVGDVTKIKVMIAPESTTNKSVTYQCSDSKIASVDSEGNVEALHVGETIITITAKSGVSTTLNVKVIPTEAEFITLNPAEATMIAQETLLLEATVYPTTTTDKNITWSSSNELVAMVDENGQVTAKIAGETDIIASTNNGVQARCHIIVVPRQMDEVTLTHSPETVHLLHGQSTNLWVKAQGGFPDGFNYEWIFKSSPISNNDNIEVIGEATNDKTISEYTVHIINCGDGVVVFDQSISFKVITWPSPDSDVIVAGSHEKIREDNIYTMSATYPCGGHDEGWDFAWHSEGQQLSQELEHSIEMSMANSAEKTIEHRTYNFSAINMSPLGEIWAEIHADPIAVDVYRAPETPRQLTCKGSGSSKVMVALFTLQDSELIKHGYRFVFGYTDESGVDHIVEKGPKRYARYDVSIYDNPEIPKWCYTEWTYEDGSIVTSRRRYADGNIDEFDGSIFDDSIHKEISIQKNPADWIQNKGGDIKIEINTDSDTQVTIYSLNGEVLFTEHVPSHNYRIIPVNSLGLNHGIYVVRVQSGNEAVVKKVNIK
ncbi:MAG: Ig-like domain-containing protein, partial [Muribaculaceae bacterium]|nr:Ig-like domain-containing protein [Muribaculaceae bacterium]